MTTRQDLIRSLLQILDQIPTAEEDALQAGIELAEAKIEVEAAEAACYLRGVEGKNTEERKARVLRDTAPWQENLQAAQEAHQRASMRLRVLMAESSILRAVSRLVASGDDDA